VAGDLRAAGLGAAPYHAGMDAEERTATQRRFMSGEADVIVATNAFGMGVDKADVRSVWHMAIPTSVEAYYQEAGRAGRDGLPARAVLLALRTDLGRLVRFNEQRAGDPELAIAHERGWRAYRAIKEFIYSDRCRRRSLLDHFGDRQAGQPVERCCDICDPDSWLLDPETISPAKRTGGGSSAPPELSADDDALFEVLRTWRLRAAGDKPAYTVASNRTLEAIAAAKPGDNAALLDVHGVGSSFISKYASEVLAIIAQHQAATPA
jgi:superfamily II DNA helicase RecQ